MAGEPNLSEGKPKKVATLTPQQERFIEEYLKTRKGAEAARRAGYSPKTARVQASRLLSNANILDEIKERVKAAKMGTDELMARLADIARGSLEDVVSFKEGPYPDAYPDLEKAREQNTLHLIREISYDKYGQPRIKMYSALEALKALAQLATDAPSGGADDPIHNVTLTLEEWRAEQARRRSEAADSMDMLDDDADDE